MEEGSHFIKSEQRGLFGGGRSEIGAQCDMGPDIFVFDFVLCFNIAHPSSRALACPGVKIGIKNGKERTILVENLIGSHLLMPNLDFIVFLETETV